ncbi:MAG: DUF2341 domain-containing protein [Kiritimatiellae bacterium]|nr:DUF2341 domain-containing protein [Kiritimatiellia bacterium]
MRSKVSFVVFTLVPALFAFAALPVDYAKKLTMTVSPAAVGYDAADVANVPVAVRLSTAIQGFSYADFNESGGGDLLFTDENGNALAHEIESWNTSGESVVWVKMPTFGSGRKLYAYYGGEAVAQNAAGVWSQYGGVWHMSEASGYVADATGNGHDAVPGGESAAQSVATTGAIGSGRVNATSGTAYLAATSTAQIGYGDTFTFSGWFLAYSADTDGEATLVTNKERRWNDSGWGIRLLKGTDTTKLIYRGRGDAGDGTLVVLDVPDLKDGWVHVSVVYGPGDTGTMYINGKYAIPYRKDHYDIGTLTSTSWLRAPSDNGYPLTFGFNANNVWDDGWSRCFHGAFDEFRISDGTKTAAQVAAEYAAQTPGALTYSVGANDASYATVTLANFTKKFTVAASGYDGSETFADFPMLVRLSTAISGFSYDDFVQSDYADLAFFDVSGNPLAFDVDTWNTAGESLVWVKVPSFASGTTVTVAYGGLVRNDVHQAATWSAYRGVWHMNETGDGTQTIADATANAMAGTSHSATAYVPAGQLGGSRRMATSRGASDQNGGVRIPFNPAMNNDAGGSFSMVASTWVNLDTGGNWGGALLMRKNGMDDGGWGFGYHYTEMNHFDYYFRASYDGIYTPHSSGGGGYTQYNATESIWKTAGAANEWHRYTVIYSWNGSYIVCSQYLDGEKGSDCWLYNYTDDGDGNSTGERSYAPLCQPTDKGLALGSFIGSGNYPLLGAMDEVRLRFGATSPTREALEYGQESNAACYSYSTVSDIDGSTVPGIVVFGEAADATVVNDTANGKVVFTIPVVVSSLRGGSATLKLMIGVAEPKDGDPALRMTQVDALPISAAGSYSFTWNGATLGTKVAYKVVSDAAIDATHIWTSETALKETTLSDSATYRWKSGTTGLWSDSANWTTSASDGLPRVGYPTSGSRFDVYGDSQTSVILVDANYEGLQGGSTLGWGNDDITFKGVVEGAAIGYPVGSGFKDGQYTNVKITLDGVSLTCGSYHVKGGSSLTMLNGAYLYTRWEFCVEGDNASLFVGDGCELNQVGVDGDRFLFAGQNASMVISNGVVKANTLRIGGSGDSDTSYVGKTPAGVSFLGDHPQLQILQYAKVHANMGGALPIVFSIPAAGYEATPIVKTGATSRSFAELNGEIPGLSFGIDRKSPFFAQRDTDTLVQRLVDWTHGGSNYAINAAGVSFRNTGRAAFSYLPKDSATKSFVEVSLVCSSGLSIIFR